MKILITGICGFVGSRLAECLLERRPRITICGIDNLMRPGSETNRGKLQRIGVRFFHGDIRVPSDFDALPAADWVIDAAAAPSVLAGRQGDITSRALFEHNLSGLLNVLEYCKTHGAGAVLLSTSRVYSIAALCSLPLRVEENAYRLDETAELPAGVSNNGIGIGFSTKAPISLYGSTKLAGEAVALEYGEAFGFPVWIDRCGVLAGAGQFGTPDQGIFSYWINAHLHRRPLRFIGFDGTGKQVRDAFHPRDLSALLDAQMATGRSGGQRVYCAGGGPPNAISLAGLHQWCDSRFGPHRPAPDPSPRLYDVPWLVMDNCDARKSFGWNLKIPLASILEEIAQHAESNPDWLEKSGL